MRDAMESAGPTRLADDFASPLVFSLMAALQDDAELEFRTLRSVLGCEGHALSGAISQLAGAGHVVVRQVSFGDVPGSWISASTRGRDAFDRHLAALREIAAGGRSRL